MMLMQFFMGSHSAPHARQLKESASGLAGIYNAHAALEMYAEIFEAADKLELLEVGLLTLLLICLTSYRTSRPSMVPSSTACLSTRRTV
jgi:dihydroorotase